MTRRPLVSILTPAYNQAAWLPDCLRSVASQTYEPLEHIVVDDGSTDETPSLLRGATPPVRYITQRNAGQSAALNRGLREARGEIIGWLNSDDGYFDVRAVETAVAAFNDYPAVDVVYGHAALVNSAGLILQMLWSPRFSRKLFRFDNFIVQPAALIRRSALVNDELADDAYHYAMDHDLWLRLIPAHRFMRLPTIVGIDRHHSGRKGIARPDLVAHDIPRLIESHGLAGTFKHRTLHRMWSIARRMVGVTLIPRSMLTDLAFSGQRDGLGNLVWRQIAVSRAAMPVGTRTS